MLELIEKGQTVNDKTYKAELPELRTRLLDLQRQIQLSGRPVIVVLAGLDNATKGALANTLNQWFDTRGLEFHAFGAKTDEELARPRFWRYWRCLPASGRIGIYSGSWYTGSLVDSALDDLSQTDFDLHMRRIADFERMLVRDGAIILKFWLHRSRKAQRLFLDQSLKKDSVHWKVSHLDRQMAKRYNRVIQRAERAIQLTDSADTPWFMVDAVDPNFRELMVGRTLAHAFEKALAQPASENNEPLPSARLPEHTGRACVLDDVDLAARLTKPAYEKRLATLSDELAELSWCAYHKGISTVIVFEGWDAAGKGGAIKRLLTGIDARISRVIQIAAPTDEEKAHHYLWRFWRHLPPAGHVTIYDRSWYGRVLVERVEGYATNEEWRRAFSEINTFEEQLTDHGMVLLKFWLHISPEEQLARFKERESLPYKQYKITEEDWRNRDKWPQYEVAVHDMVVHTSPEAHHWHLVAANDKRHARIAVLEAVCDALRTALSKRRKKRKQT